MVHPSGEIGIDLLIGWIAFLARVVPQLEVRWDGIAILLVGLIALVALGHGFLRWLYRASAEKADAAAPPREWRLRWTLVLVGFLVLMFVAGITVTGVTHQIAWLFRSPEPLFGESAKQFYYRSSESNLRELGFGVLNAGEVQRKTVELGRKDRPTADQSWATQIIPYINYSFGSVYDPQLPWDHPKNAQTFRSILWPLVNPEFRNPPYHDARGYALNHYAGNTRIFDSQKPMKRSARDGSSNVLLIGEVSGQFVPWGQPENSREPTRGFGTAEGFCGARPDGGAQFVMQDGRVRYLAEDIDPRVLEQLSDPSDVEKP
jgi:hypothetical protein